MPTFISPVSLSEFQRYLKDTTTDTAILALYQSLLDTATEKVYTYLDRDYTPSAPKTDIFWGTGMHTHRMNNQAGALTSWKYYDAKGNETVVSISELVLMANGMITVAANKRFECAFEHRIVYTQPVLLTCPESVKQVIIEVAAIVFEESKQGAGNLGKLTESVKADADFERVRYLDLSSRQRMMLAPYKRIAV